MNYKLYVLLLILPLATNPALQAMRARSALVTTARSLHNPALQAGRQALTHTQFTKNNERERFYDESHSTRQDYYLPAAALAIGLGLTTQQAMDEHDESLQLPKLDIYNINAVIDVLQNGTEDDKRLVTEKVAQKITHYNVEDIIHMLQCTQRRPHRTIVNALAKNITQYTPQQIAQILTGDAQDETHDLIASALNKNYNNFTGYTISGYRLLSHADYLYEYAKAINSLKEKYRGKAIDPLADDLDKNTVEDGLGWNIRKILENSPKQSKQVILSALIQNMNNNKQATIRDIRYYIGFDEVLKHCNEHNAKKIIAFIVKNINFLSMASSVPGYYREIIVDIHKACGEQSQEIIMSAFTQKVDDLMGQHEIDSQSAAHLKENIIAAWQYVTIIANNPKYKTAFQQALTHEHSISGDSAVFYHSQKSPIYWLELLYTKLWEQKYNQKSTNYLFTRFPDDQKEFANAVLQFDGQEKRTALLKQGRIQGSNELRPYLFFVNYALFGNSTNWGSCSARYFINNFNVGDPSITTQTIIERFGDQAIFGKYKAELEQLENEFKEIVPNSVLLQLVIPHEVLNEHVYLAAPGGYKKTLQISGEEVDNVNTIIKALKSNPKAFDQTDQHEFCLVMTPDTVHTLREQGAEVRAYGDFDQDKLDALNTKLEKLIARIAQENPQTFSAKMTPMESYQAYKPVLDELIKKKD